jgi:hypothetical protein
MFKHGKKDGEGTETSPNGTKFVGYWLNDKKHVITR